MKFLFFYIRIPTDNELSSSRHFFKVGPSLQAAHVRNRKVRAFNKFKPIQNRFMFVLNRYDSASDMIILIGFQTLFASTFATQ